MGKEINTVAEACRSNEKLRALIKWLAGRDRWRAVSDMRRLRQSLAKDTKVSLSGAEMRDLGRILTKAGVGKLKLGKNPMDPDRFQWDENYVEFAKDVLEAMGEVEPRPAEPAPRRAYMGNHHPMASQTLTVPLPLRGQILKFEIFPDLTKDELESIVLLLKSYCR